MTERSVTNGPPVAAPPIVFSHANGFPAGSYARLFDAWRDAGFAVHAVDKFGHDPRYPVTSNWPRLRDQLNDFIAAEVGSPALLVGHSLGGYLSLLAASRRPELAAGVVLLDSPVLGGWKARVVQVAKATRVGERWSPAHVSKRRRRQWSDSAAARAHFASKKAFAAFAPGVLDDYLSAGLEADDEGVRLAFDRRVETAIYNALPHHVPAVLRRHPLQCPLAFVGGTASDELRRVGIAATERLARGRIAFVEGSHLFPFERPDETAAAVLRAVAGFGSQRQAA